MKHLLYIGNKLSRHGATATAIETLGPLLAGEGFAMHYASSKKSKVLRMAEMAWRTVSLRNKVSYVLIDTYSTQNFWYAVIVGWICRRFHLKYIPILHGGNLPSRLKNNPKSSAALFGKSYRNVAPSGYLLQAFNAAGFDAAFLPNPFDASQFPFTDRATIAPRMLWVRSFSPIYNPEMAVECFALVKNRFPDASLCMVGPDKGLLNRVRELAKSRALTIEFTGRLTKAQWAAKSTACDIFINTATIDNAPFSIIEAAALGLIIVSTRVGGIPYLLKDGETALLVPENDAKAMAEAIIGAVENPELCARLLENSRKLAGDSEWQSVRPRWLEILK